MTKRGIALLSAAVQRYARAHSSIVAPSVRLSSVADVSYAPSAEKDGRQHKSERQHGRVRLLAAAGAFSTSFGFSTSFAFSSIDSSGAKERIAVDRLPKDVVLYQYEACPFCNKVRSFLDYHDIPYNVVEVNPVGKKELKWSEYKKVPVLVVDGEQLNDSSEIITILNKRFNKSEPLKEEDKEEEEWRRWVDEHLVHLLSPNIYRSATEALEAFEYMTKNGNFTATERITGKYFGATAMYFISKRLKKRYNIVDERSSLYEAAETWVKALNGRKYMGGEKPNLADLAVFGVLRPIRHLQTGEDMMANTTIGTWYVNMEEVVGPSARLSSNFQTSDIGKPIQSTVGS